jgi:5-formyltetrahydrofolate cyclo-ligase
VSPARARRHDADAGGDRAVLDAKAALRDEVWSAMERPGVRRFPAPRNRIPNFVGAEAGAARLRATDVWRRAHTIKCNPDSAQLPVRRAALEDGKLVYMAVPRLAEPRPFFLLDPERLSTSIAQAATIKGASQSARRVDVDAMDAVDLVVAGCVAVDETGARLGKGGGFSDLEFAVASAAGLVGARTRVATTVHDLQVVEPGRIPLTRHDVRLDLVVTPTRTIVVRRTGRRVHPTIDWADLTDDKIASIPLLQRLRP